MCGIAGFCNGYGDPVLQIRKMTDKIIRRGPDSEGYWISEDKTVVLGHRRLSVLDCSDNGSQPMISRSGRYVISYNGEIYNHWDIRKALELRGVSFRGTSDTETLVEAFDFYGIDYTIDKIKGMYAIALYDTLDRTLYLIRDRVGEKPLYYGFMKGSFVFASDVSCFRAIDDNGLEIDSASVELFFRRGYIPAPFAIFKEIYKLEPGHYLRVNYPFSEIKDSTYWSAFDVAVRCHNNPFKGSIEDAEHELERLLKEALRGQMLSDVPLGAFLSAGIDSSTIVALMQEISDKPIRTFTIGVDDKEYDEAPVARKVAEILGTHHTEEYVSISDIQSVIPQIGLMYGEPFADSSQIPTSIICRVARKDVTVALSGDGGDELFCGYERYNGWVVEEWKKQQRFPLPVQRLRSAAMHIVGKGNTVKARKLRSSSIAQTYSIVAGADTGFVWTERKYRDFFDRFDGFKGGVFPSDQDILMQMDFGEYLPDDILAKVDRAAMYHSLETRIPFLDKDVIEFVWTLPLEMKYNNSITKFVLRKMLYKHVPEPLIERPKMGFSIPIDRWMREGFLKEMCNELYSDYIENSALSIFDIESCRILWDKFFLANEWSISIWYILIFLMWYKGNN